MIENELKPLYNYLSQHEPVVDIVFYEQVILQSPDWLIQKLQIFPGKELANKLTCLLYQLSEFKDTAVDIEDQYLNLGVSKADLTYTLPGNKGYKFVDVTTSTDKNLIKEKEINLKLQLSSKNIKAPSEVRVIPRYFVLKEGFRFFGTRTVDNLDYLFRSILESDTKTRSEFVSFFSDFLYPKVSAWSLDEINEASEDIKLSGEIRYDLSKHDDKFSDIDQPIAIEVLKMMRLLKGITTKSSIKIPIPKSKLIVNDLKPDINDPINVALVAAVQYQAVMEPNVIYKFEPGNRFEEWDIFESIPSEVSKYLKYSKNGKTRLQHVAERDLPNKIYLVVGEDRSTSASGITFPKLMTVATSISSENFGSIHLNRDDTQLPSIKSYGVLSEYSDEELIDAIDYSLKSHNNEINFLQTAAETVTSSWHTKLVKVSKLSESEDWLRLFLGAYRADDISGKHFFKTIGYELVSCMYSYARVIGIALSEKTPLHRFRIMLTPEEDAFVAVSTSHRATSFNNVAVSIAAIHYTSDAIPRSKNRTISLSSREISWWIRLMPTVLLKYMTEAQHNLVMGPESPDRIVTKDIIEFALMHMNTRQTDSFIQDQLRYTLAGMYSPLTTQFGAVAKIESNITTTNSMLVYTLRLAKLQAISYLTKGGMIPKLTISNEVPIRLSPPFQSSPITTYSQYIDAVFDSAMFNKIKDRKVDSQAIDWLGLLDTDIEYQRVKLESPSIIRGYSDELEHILSDVKRFRDITPFLDDIRKGKESAVYSSALSFMGLSKHASKNFRWNAMAFLSIVLNKTRGRTLVENTDDFTSPIPILGKQSLSDLMSSSGSMASGEANQSRQAVRKSTAICGFLVETTVGKTNDKHLGMTMSFEADEHPGYYQSLFGCLTSVLRMNGTNPLVSRTEDKDQKGPWREFSPMNAVGVVSTRAAERLIIEVLPMYKIDRMSDPDTEHTLYSEVTETQHDSRTIFSSHDCSRFGPNQNMSKSRVLSFALCLNEYDNDNLRKYLIYETLSEATRLMGAKIAKMPQELFETLVDWGGLATIQHKNPNSVYGKIATRYLDQGKRVVPTSMVQEWGMYQGAMGMFSSLASSILHEFSCDLLLKNEVASTVKSIVTNDDSLIIASNVNVELTMKEASRLILKTSQVSLLLGGQILNMFKSIPTPVIAEFHSTFALKEGLICPELKMLFAALQVSSGESIYKDARQPIENAISAMRKGVSLFSATGLGFILTVLFCDQYNRWPSVKSNGIKLAQLGGPCSINLVGELFVPNFSDMRTLKQFDASNEQKARFLANSSMYETEEDLLSAQSLGIRMLTRHKFRELRSLKEMNWPQVVKFTPISGSCTRAHLFSVLSAGLLKPTVEQGLSDLLVRFSRNQVSRTNKSISIVGNSIAYSALSKDEVSYDELDSLSKQHINDAIVKISDMYEPTKNDMLDPITQGFLSVVKIVDIINTEVPTVNKLLRTPITRNKVSLVHPTRIKGTIATMRKITPVDVINEFGTDELKNIVAKELRGDFSHGPIFENYKKEYTNALALSSLTNRINAHKTGPLMTLVHLPRFVSIDEAIVAIAQNTIRGMSNTSPLAREVIELSRVTFIPEAMSVVTQTNKQKFVVMLKSNTLRANYEFFMRPHELAETFKTTKEGWWTIGSTRWKALQLRKETRESGRKTFAVGVMITEEKIVNKIRTFDHYIYTDSTSLKLTEWKNFPSFLLEKFPSNVVAGQLYASSTSRDTLTVAGHTFLSKAVTKMTNEGLLYLDFDAIKLPLVYNRQNMNPYTTITVKSKGRIAKESDIRVFASAASHRYADARIKEASHNVVSVEHADIILATYGSPPLKNLINGSTVTSPKFDSIEAEIDFKTASENVVSWFKQETEPYEEEDVDDYILPFLEADFNGEYIDANVGYVEEEDVEAINQETTMEPEERILESVFFSEGTDIWAELARDEEDY